MAGLGLLAPAGALCLAFAAGPANADALLTISDGTNLITLNDGGTGQIVFDSLTDSSWNPAGGWLLEVDLATTEPLTGSVQYPDMHLTVAATGVGSLTVTFTDDAFSGDGMTQFLTQVGGVIAGGTGNSVTTSSSTSAGSLASFGPAGPGVVSGAKSNLMDVTGPYTLSLATTLTQAQLGTSSLDANVQVPEPGTLALLGAGILGCVLIVRRPRLPAWQRARIRRRS